MPKTVQLPAGSVVALFGGSFDPPHRAHCAIPTFLLEQKLADQVWYIPVKNHPFGKRLSSDQDRINMVQFCIDQAVKDHPEFASKLRVDTWEIEKNTSSYTIQTLDDLAAQYPDISFRWVIGTDNLAKFHLWGKDAQRIPSDYGMFVYPRSGYPPTPLLPGMTFLKDAPEVNASSTEIRELMKDHHALKALKKLVLPEIEEYIVQHHLYQ
jgi:nicotinate-nucleotide adenylyltransferase